MTPATVNPNAATIAELRRVADILDANPDLPEVHAAPQLIVCAFGADEATRVAAVDRLNAALGIDDQAETWSGLYGPRPEDRWAAYTSVVDVPATAGGAA
jgi:hypothetical protein